MNVRVVTVLHGKEFWWDNAAATLNTTVLQVVHGAETTTFPLCNVMSFTTSESEIS